MTMSVDVWVRGTGQARTETLTGVPENPAVWTDADVRQLLTEMLLAIDRVQNPGGEAPAVSLRGFNWIVSPDAAKATAVPPPPPGGTDRVLLHVEMRMGTASAGPFAIGEEALSTMIERVMASPAIAPTVH
jgi:hypothetical protein